MNELTLLLIRGPMPYLPSAATQTMPGTAVIIRLYVANGNRTSIVMDDATVTKNKENGAKVVHCDIQNANIWGLKCLVQGGTRRLSKSNNVAYNSNRSICSITHESSTQI